MVPDGTGYTIAFNDAVITEAERGALVLVKEKVADSPVRAAVPMIWAGDWVPGSAGMVGSAAVFPAA